VTGYITRARLEEMVAAGERARISDTEILLLAGEVKRRRDAGGIEAPGEPIPMRLPCPSCGELHIDEGEFATKPHHTHACQACGMVWRPAIVPTVGVRFLPGFKNTEGK
jgi:predicted RNA-binding Zn-ribbon protein involved in translation (DUF1610 family)